MQGHACIRLCLICRRSTTSSSSPLPHCCSTVAVACHNNRQWHRAQSIHKAAIRAGDADGVGGGGHAMSQHSRRCRDTWFGVTSISVHPPTHLSIHSPVCPAIRPSLCLCVHPCVNPSVRPRFSVSVRVFIRVSVRPSVRLRVRVFACPSVRVSFRPSVCPGPCVLPSVDLSVCPSIRRSVRVSVRPCVRPPAPSSMHPAYTHPSIQTNPYMCTPYTGTIFIPRFVHMFMYARAHTCQHTFSYHIARIDPCAAQAYITSTVGCLSQHRTE